jgi:hypothetical protein
MSNELDDAADPKGPNAEIRLASNDSEGEFSADDLREWVTRLQVMADNARIPNEPFQLDIGDEVKKLVDKLLAGKTAP